MRERLGIVVAACLYYSGLVKLARWLMQRGKPHLIILNYHRASGGDLRRHLLYLRRHYRMLHLEEALEELYNDHTGKQDQRTPLVLTFDDGYYDNYTHALKLARELAVPITIFLIPGYINSGAYFWWLEGKRLAQHITVEEITVEGRTYRLKEERDELVRTIENRLWQCTSVAEREAFLASIRELLAVPTELRDGEDGDRPLTWEEVAEMEQSGYVSFGAHTMHHPVLAYLRDAEEVHREVSECRAVLEEHLGYPVRAFAYPVGRDQHIGDTAIRAVREAGYSWAVTTMSGLNTAQSDPYQLKRVLGDVSRHWLVMAAEVSGAWNWFSPLWKNPFFRKRDKEPGLISGNDVARQNQSLAV
ncbi:MAG TPA: polysaccharide deacetylase family protein [Ktedonobacteraceae bacterium]|jgi:peptidoglycan/xylan/chitin deacetylase (PgdA/CDA1 family)|nr:polysaccharide deacetylase family protein [Ktedonobacteraceae bacterium]